MRNFFIFLVLVVLGIKFGAEYLMGPKFQEYANRTKEPWTCQFENTVGQFYMMMSQYDYAETFFQHTMKRCPDSPYMEEAEFQIARCTEGRGESRRAADMYTAFAEKYKSSPRARTAEKAAGLIR